MRPWIVAGACLCGARTTPTARPPGRAGWSAARRRSACRSSDAGRGYCLVIASVYAPAAVELYCDTRTK